MMGSCVGFSLAPARSPCAVAVNIHHRTAIENEDGPRRPSVLIVDIDCETASHNISAEHLHALDNGPSSLNDNEQPRAQCSVSI
jgi:hypothetical protein